MEIDAEALELIRRQSGIHLRADGIFTYAGEPVPNPRVQALFHRGVEVRADDEVTLTVGARWCYLTCDGVARFIEGMRLEGSDAIVRLRTGEELPWEPLVVGYAPDDRLYGWLPGLRGPALLTRAAHHALLERVGADGAITIGQRRIPVLALEDVPGAASGPPPGRA